MPVATNGHTIGLMFRLVANSVGSNFIVVGSVMSVKKLYSNSIVNGYVVTSLYKRALQYLTRSLISCFGISYWDRKLYTSS